MRVFLIIFSIVMFFALLAAHEAGGTQGMIAFLVFGLGWCALVIGVAAVAHMLRKRETTQ